VFRERIYLTHRVGLHDADPVWPQLPRRSILSEERGWRLFMPDENDDRRFFEDLAIDDRKTRLRRNKSFDRFQSFEMCIYFFLDRVLCGSVQHAHADLQRYGFEQKSSLWLQE
jgi:hypothetical protein